ncbi:MAG: hypothetical protein JNK65_07825 [Deltaproteobacteria bacterium]|nr:hypothetical protein [Deltaproteobacteria bacterium]
MKKILYFLLLSLTACSGSSLIQNNPPEGKLFGQVHLTSLEDHHAFTVEGIEIHPDNIQLHLLRLEPLLSQKLSQHSSTHEVIPTPASNSDSHSEPTHCDFENLVNIPVLVNISKHSDIPCMTLQEGLYSGVKLEFGPSADKSQATLIIEGEAHQNEMEYPFEIRSEEKINLILTQNFHLDSNEHHFEIKIALKEWFHGIDFSSLEQSAVKVLIDETHNSEVYEHFIEHVRESFSIEQ